MDLKWLNLKIYFKRKRGYRQRHKTGTIWYSVSVVCLILIGCLTKLQVFVFIMSCYCNDCLIYCDTAFHLCVFVRTGESLHNCPYLAVWSLDPVVQMVTPHVLLDVVVHERSLSRGMPLTCPPPEQYFNSTTYNFGRC